MWWAIGILGILIGVLFYLFSKLKKELNEKTVLFWEEVDGFKVLKNSKGEEITRL
jgi:hypothetical protein